MPVEQGKRNLTTEMRRRTKAFALGAVLVCRLVPKTRETQVPCDQLVRSSTSAAANYRAACRARSRREFIAKLVL